MSKIGLIIEREYTTRVFKKSFILLTFLSPILFAALIAVPLWLAQIDNDEQKEIVVVDKSGLYKQALVSDGTFRFDFTDAPMEQVRQDAPNSLTGILLITGDLAEEGKATLYSDKQIDVETQNHVESLLSEYVERMKLAAYNIPGLKQMVEDARTDITVSTVKWSEDGEEKEASAELALVIGMVTAFIIYMFIVMYGAQVMSSVIQEKTNRIVEVVVSSVKPFDLMMGKIISIALVGLTQVLMWVLLTLLLSRGVLSLMGLDAVATTPDTAATEQVLNRVYTMVSGFDFGRMLLCFLIYFLGGYLLYASLFAAVGSAVENETDTNQFTLPLTIPIIFAIYAAIYTAQNPDGPLAFWCSLIPFTSPVVMMVRLPFDVPMWQLLLSIGLLVLSFVLTTWMAGKIYRTGILMYGKKVTWSELWKWLRY